MGDKTLATRLAEHLDAAMAQLKAQGIEPPLHWSVKLRGFCISSIYGPSLEDGCGTTAFMVRLLEEQGVQLPVKIAFHTPDAMERPVMWVALDRGGYQLHEPAPLPN